MKMSRKKPVFCEYVEKKKPVFCEDVENRISPRTNSGCDRVTQGGHHLIVYVLQYMWLYTIYNI